jgi:hypothetical protein
MAADIDGVKRISEILKFRGTRCQGSQVRIRLSAEGNPVRTLGSTDRSSGSTHIRPIIVPRPRRCSTAALADGFVPLESDRRHCRIRLHRSRTLVISVPFPKETRIHKWDHEFESAFLQHAVCLSSEPRGCMRKAPHFGGILRVAGDVRRDVPAANRAFFALSL